MNSNRIEIVEMARYLADGEHFFLEYNDADVFISPHLHQRIRCSHTQPYCPRTMITR